MKVNESKKANTISEDLELSLEELAKNRPIKTVREEAKAKAEEEIKQVVENQNDLFKLSLNKDKPHFKEIEKVDIIAEANSSEEVSTLKNSLTGRAESDSNEKKGILKKGHSGKPKALKSQNINFSQAVLDKNKQR